MAHRAQLAESELPIATKQQQVLYIWDEDAAEESSVATGCINLGSHAESQAIRLPAMGELQALLTSHSDASSQPSPAARAELPIRPLTLFGVDTTSPFDPISAGLAAPGQCSHLQPSAASAAQQPSSHQSLLSAPMSAPDAISLHQRLLLQHHQLQLLLRPPQPAHASMVPAAQPQQQQQQACWSPGAQQQLLLPTKAEATSSVGTAATAVAGLLPVTAPGRGPGQPDAMEVDSCQPGQQEPGVPQQGKTGNKKPAPGRRGRPPKVQGEYSKGYLAIKRHRERKKSEIESMEDLIAKKRQLLADLTAENKQLVARLQALSYKAQRSNLVLKLDPIEQKTAAPAASNNTSPTVSPMAKGNSSPGLGSTTAAPTTSSNSSACSFGAAAGAGLATCASSSAPPAAAAGAGSASLQMEQQSLDAAGLTTRYRVYVQACAARVMCEAEGSVPPAGSPGSPPWPEYPFDMQSSLALWQLDTPPTDTNLAAEGLALNLDSGRYEAVLEGVWGRVASQVALRPGQRDRLAAAWEMFAGGLARLNSERRQLREGLGAVAAGLEWEQATPAGAAWHLSLCGAGWGLEQQEALADEVEASLVQGQVVVTSGSWALKQQLDAEQFGKLTVASWPRLPLLRAIVGCILCRPEQAAVGGA